MEGVGGYGALGSGEVVSEEEAADEGGLGGLKEEPGAAEEGAGRGRMWPGWRRGEESCLLCLGKSLPF